MCYRRVSKSGDEIRRYQAASVCYWHGAGVWLIHRHHPYCPSRTSDLPCAVCRVLLRRKRLRRFTRSHLGITTGQSMRAALPAHRPVNLRQFAASCDHSCDSPGSATEDQTTRSADQVSQAGRDLPERTTPWMAIAATPVSDDVAPRSTTQPPLSSRCHLAAPPEPTMWWPRRRQARLPALVAGWSDRRGRRGRQRVRGRWHRSDEPRGRAADRGTCR